MLRMATFFVVLVISLYFALEIRYIFLNKTSEKTQEPFSIESKIVVVISALELNKYELKRRSIHIHRIDINERFLFTFGIEILNRRGNKNWFFFLMHGLTKTYNFMIFPSGNFFKKNINL